MPVNPNVAPLSLSVAASILAQYVSFSVAPAGLGDPGPLQYAFSTHDLAHRNDTTSPHCATETAEGAGDHRVCLTGFHEDAERQRHSQGRWEPAFAFSGGSTIVLKKSRGGWTAS